MAEQVDRVTVGIMGGAPLLGLYDAAKKYGTFAFVELHQPLTEVAVASLSRVRHDPDALRRYTRNTFAPILAVSIALLGFLATETAGVLQVLFGAKWVPAAYMMRALAVGMIAASIGKLALWVSLSVGDTHRPFRWVSWTTPIIVASVVVAAQFGGDGVATAIGATNIVFAIPLVVFLLKPTAVRSREVISAWIVPVVAAGAGVAALLLADGRLPSPTTLIGLVVRALAYGAVYLLAFVVQPGGPGMLRAMFPARSGGNATT
jgi:PST family polysaccharide transporter